MSDDITD